MGKRTQVKAHQRSEPSASEQHELIGVPPANGSLQRVFPATQCDARSLSPRRFRPSIRPNRRACLPALGEPWEASGN